MPPREETVTSRSNGRVQLLRAAVAGQVRRSEGLAAIEGDHLLEEAVQSGVALHTVFIAGERTLPKWLPENTAVVRLPVDLFRSVVETQTPQGIAALIEPPTWTAHDVIRGLPLVLVLAEVQDPGNVGTLLRSAEAFGATGVVLSAGSASLWSGKALRAAAGSAFRLPSLRVGSAAEARTLLAHVRLLAAVAAGNISRSIDDRRSPRVIGTEALTSPLALMIGNEGSGLGRDWLDIADAEVTVPCSGPVESLNAAVAGAVLLYEVQQQRAAGGALSSDHSTGTEEASSTRLARSR